LEIIDFFLLFMIYSQKVNQLLKIFWKGFLGIQKVHLSLNFWFKKSNNEYISIFFIRTTKFNYWVWIPHFSSEICVESPPKKNFGKKFMNCFSEAYQKKIFESNFGMNLSFKFFGKLFLIVFTIFFLRKTKKVKNLFFIIFFFKKTIENILTNILIQNFIKNLKFFYQFLMLFFYKELMIQFQHNKFRV